MKRPLHELAALAARGDVSHETLANGNSPTEMWQLACLIDIMLSLRQIRDVLKCGNTQKIPQHLRALEHLAREFWVKPRRRRKKVRQVS